jgi:hypothetical protein
MDTPSSDTTTQRWVQDPPSSGGASTDADTAADVMSKTASHENDKTPPWTSRAQVTAPELPESSRDARPWLPLLRSSAGRSQKAAVAPSDDAASPAASW